MDKITANSTEETFNNIFDGIKKDCGGSIDDVFMDFEQCKSDSGFISYSKNDNSMKGPSSSSTCSQKNSEDDVFNVAYIEINNTLNCQAGKICSVEDPITQECFENSEVESKIDNVDRESDALFANSSTIENAKSFFPETMKAESARAKNGLKNSVEVYSNTLKYQLSSESVKILTLLPSLCEDTRPENEDRNLRSLKRKFKKDTPYFPPLADITLSGPELSSKSDSLTKAGTEINKEYLYSPLHCEIRNIPNTNENINCSVVVPSGLVSDFVENPTVFHSPSILLEDITLAVKPSNNDVCEEALLGNSHQQLVGTDDAVISKDIVIKSAEVSSQRTIRNLDNLKMIQNIIKGQLKQIYPLLEIDSCHSGHIARKSDNQHKFRNLSTIQEVDSDLSKGSDTSSFNQDKSLKIENSGNGGSTCDNVITANNVALTAVHNKERTSAYCCGLKSRIPVHKTPAHHDGPSKTKEPKVKNGFLPKTASTKVSCITNISPRYSCMKSLNKVQVSAFSRKKSLSSPGIQRKVNSPAMVKVNSPLKEKHNTQKKDLKAQKIDCFQGIEAKKSNQFKLPAKPVVSKAVETLVQEKGILEEPDLTLIGPELTLHRSAAKDQCESTISHVPPATQCSESLMSFLQHEMSCMNCTDGQISLLK